MRRAVARGPELRRGPRQADVTGRTSRGGRGRGLQFDPDLPRADPALPRASVRVAGDHEVPAPAAEDLARIRRLRHGDDRRLQGHDHAEGGPRHGPVVRGDGRSFSEILSVTCGHLRVGADRSRTPAARPERFGRVGPVRAASGFRATPSRDFVSGPQCGLQPACGGGTAAGGRSSMVERQPSKLLTRVRFPSPAPGAGTTRVTAEDSVSCRGRGAGSRRRRRTVRRRDLRTKVRSFQAGFAVRGSAPAWFPGRSLP